LIDCGILSRFAQILAVTSLQTKPVSSPSMILSWRRYRLFNFDDHKSTKYRAALYCQIMPCRPTICGSVIDTEAMFNIWGLESIGGVGGGLDRDFWFASILAIFGILFLSEIGDLQKGGFKGFAGVLCSLKRYDKFDWLLAPPLQHIPIGRCGTEL